MTLSPVFYNRDLTPKLIKLDVDYSVDSLSWKAVGGCDKATIKASSASPVLLWEFIEYLRCPVEVYDEYQRASWWGYVNEVRIDTGAFVVGVSLDEMANQVIALWSVPGASGTHNTAKHKDQTSVDEYGPKYKIYTIQAATGAMADSFLDTVLARTKYPIPKFDYSTGQMNVELVCKGWWNILSWLVYFNAATTAVDTATQISTMITSQFISGWPTPWFPAVYLDLGTSGISTNQFRDHMQLRDVQTQVEELLKMGTSNNLRMLASVDINRAFHVTEEPASSAATDYYLDGAGNLKTTIGVPIPYYLPPVGNFLRMQDIIPATVDASRLADPTKIFIEDYTWSPTSFPQITPRDVQSVYDLYNLKAK